jgi:3-dehydroquinate dehydratase type I
MARGVPLTVASLGAWPYDVSGADLAGIDALELRFDLMGVSAAGLPQVMEVVRRRVPRVIAACRPGGGTEEDRVALLCEAARLGAWAVDVEIDAPAVSRAEVLRAARLHGCRVIISHHDDERTPTREALTQVVRRAFAAGADIVKIACRVVTPADNATLLGLLDEAETAGRIAVVGMGRLGRLTRVVAPALGSALAYVSFAPGLETADGQPTREALLRARSALEEPA